MLFGVILLLFWMPNSVASEDIVSSFLRDLLSTFQLNSPTIIYSSDEAPDICTSGTGYWVLCLSHDHDGGIATEVTELDENSKFGSSDSQASSSMPNLPLCRRVLHSGRSKQWHEMCVSLQRIWEEVCCVHHVRPHQAMVLDQGRCQWCTHGREPLGIL